MANAPQIKTLNADQQRVIDLAFDDSRSNLFVTGAAGTGKSYTLRCLAESLQLAGQSVVICAPTGTAAVNCGGVTIHRAFNLHGGACINPVTMQIAAHTSAAIKRAEVVIIDEISMCRLDLFDCVAASLAKAEEQTNIHKQIIVFGDFLQLPPVTDDKHGERELLERYYGSKIGKGYAFQSDAWQRMHFKPVKLTQIVRQNDTAFIHELGLARCGDQSCISYFNQHSMPLASSTGTYICGTRAKVDSINEEMLAMLPGESRMYQGIKTQNVNESDMMVPEFLILKENARVMMAINDPTGYGNYYNGSTGVIAKLADNSITVRLDSGRTVCIDRYEWEIKEYVTGDGGKAEQQTIGTFTQFPLKLAYAVTIHKSQGGTFDSINLDPQSWDSGQLYVALSRVKSISGLHLVRKIKPRNLIVDPLVLQFYTELLKKEQNTTGNESEIEEIDTDESADVEKDADSLETATPKPKVMGRPRKYSGTSRTMRVPDSAADDIKQALTIYAKHPDKYRIVAVPVDMVDTIQGFLKRSKDR